MEDSEAALSEQLGGHHLPTLAHDDAAGLVGSGEVRGHDQVEVRASEALRHPGGLEAALGVERIHGVALDDLLDVASGLATEKEGTHRLIGNIENES